MLSIHVLVRAGHAVFVRPAVDADVLDEIAMRRRRGRVPFHRRRVPRVVARLPPDKQRRAEIDDERNLRRREEEGGARHEFIPMQRGPGELVGQVLEIRAAAGTTAAAQMSTT